MKQRSPSCPVFQYTRRDNCSPCFKILFTSYRGTAFPQESHAAECDVIVLFRGTFAEIAVKIGATGILPWNRLNEARHFGGRLVDSQFYGMEFSFDISDFRALPGIDRLSGLEGPALVRELRVFLGDVARGADIQVDGTLVTVSHPEPTRHEADEANRLYEKAGHRAHRGEFDKAVGIYRRVLELDPTRHEARRDLAMVLVEKGDAEEAKGLLLDVLKVNPRDVGALTILGNHYARVENDAETAERFFRRAIELNPEDATAHNSLGGMLCEKKLYDEALTHFDLALSQRPSFPQPRYGKAMVFLSQGRLPEARNVMGEIFVEADLTDSRNARMLESARESYLKFTNIIANENAAASAAASGELLQKAEEASGFRALVKREPLPGIQLG